MATPTTDCSPVFDDDDFVLVPSQNSQWWIPKENTEDVPIEPAPEQEEVTADEQSESDTTPLSEETLCNASIPSDESLAELAPSDFSAVEAAQEDKEENVEDNNYEKDIQDEEDEEDEEDEIVFDDEEEEEEEEQEQEEEEEEDDDDDDDEEGIYASACADPWSGLGLLPLLVLLFLSLVLCCCRMGASKSSPPTTLQSETLNAWEQPHNCKTQSSAGGKAAVDTTVSSLNITEAGKLAEEELETPFLTNVSQLLLGRKGKLSMSWPSTPPPGYTRVLPHNDYHKLLIGAGEKSIGYGTLTISSSLEITGSLVITSHGAVLPAPGKKAATTPSEALKYSLKSTVPSKHNAAKHSPPEGSGSGSGSGSTPVLEDVLAVREQRVRQRESQVQAHYLQRQLQLQQLLQLQKQREQQLHEKLTAKENALSATESQLSAVADREAQLQELLAQKDESLLRTEELLSEMHSMLIQHSDIANGPDVRW